MNIMHQKRGTQSAQIVVKFSRVKKRFITQKFNALGPFILFFHYNGSEKYNWGKVKRKLWQQGIECKSLYMPNGVGKDIACKLKVDPIKMGAPCLMVACSSIYQMCVIAEMCLNPAFFCIGVRCDDKILSHLELKEWMLLYKQNALAVTPTPTGCAGQKNKNFHNKLILSLAPAAENMIFFLQTPQRLSYLIDNFLRTQLMPFNYLANHANRIAYSTAYFLCT